MIYVCVKFQKDTLYGLNSTFFATWLPWERRHFEFLEPQKLPHTYGGYSYKVSWNLMKGIQKKIWIPLFCFYGNCGKVCPTDSDFFGLSRSTRCGCCSYQVSSISVWRVTRYDHFCGFQFFSIFAVSMATAANLKNNYTEKNNFTWHMIFLQGFIKFDQGISEK